MLTFAYKYIELFFIYRLQKHEQELSTCLIEKDTIVTEANVFIKKATLIQNLLAEKNKRLQHLEKVREAQKERALSCTTSKFSFFLLFSINIK